jgi:hypothetical protein
MKHAARIMPSVCATTRPSERRDEMAKTRSMFAMRSFSSRGALTAISLFTAPTQSHLIPIYFTEHRWR